ncbi:hypothetical protein ADUPG1_008861, partial [Aduncisulcus paluster]
VEVGTWRTGKHPRVELEEPDHDVTRSDHLVHNRGSRTVKATEPTPREDTDKGNLGSKNRSFAGSSDVPELLEYHKRFVAILSPLSVHCGVISDTPPIKKVKTHSMMHLQEWIDDGGPLRNYSAETGERTNATLYRLYRYIRTQSTRHIIASRSLPFLTLPGNDKDPDIRFVKDSYNLFKYEEEDDAIIRFDKYSEDNTQVFGDVYAYLDFSEKVPSYLDVTDAVLEDPLGFTEDQVKERETTVSAYYNAIKLSDDRDSAAKWKSGHPVYLVNGEKIYQLCAKMRCLLSDVIQGFDIVAGCDWLFDTGILHSQLVKSKKQWNTASPNDGVFFTGTGRPISAA